MAKSSAFPLRKPSSFPLFSAPASKLDRHSLSLHSRFLRGFREDFHISEEFTLRKFFKILQSGSSLSLHLYKSYQSRNICVTQTVTQTFSAVCASAIMYKGLPDLLNIENTFSLLGILSWAIQREVQAVCYQLTKWYFFCLHFQLRSRNVKVHLTHVLKKVTKYIFAIRYLSEPNLVKLPMFLVATDFKDRYTCTSITLF